MRPTPHPRRSAFTLVEVLTAVAIIAILVAMLFIGLNVITGKAKGDLTATALRLGNSLITEYETQGGSITDLDLFYGNRKMAPASVNSVDETSFGDINVVITTNIMRKLTASPRGRGIVADAPKDLLEKDAKFLLDASRKPLIYVPSFGLLGVKAPRDSKGAIQSGAMYSSGKTYSRGDTVVSSDGYFYTWIGTTAGSASPPTGGGAPSGTNTWGGLCSPDVRPYFASPGPDGNFTTGEDNQYSFSVK